MQIVAVGRERKSNSVYRKGLVNPGLKRNWFVAVAVGRAIAMKGGDRALPAVFVFRCCCSVSPNRVGLMMERTFFALFYYYVLR